MQKELKKFDQIWETIHSGQEWGKYPPEHVIRFTMRHFKNKADRRKIRILDIGCGGAQTHSFFPGKDLMCMRLMDPILR